MEMEKNQQIWWLAVFQSFGELEFYTGKLRKNLIV